MTLDDAMAQYKAISRAFESAGISERALEAGQMVKWLRNARGAEKAIKWYEGKLQAVSYEADKSQASLRAENDRLRNCLMALMRGLYIERCADMDGTQCEKCSMHRNNHECAVTDAMELIGFDAIEEFLLKD